MSRTAVVHSFGAPPARLPRRVRPSTLFSVLGSFFVGFIGDMRPLSLNISSLVCCFLNSLRL